MTQRRQSDVLQLVWPNHVSLLSEEAPDLKTVATAFFHGFFPLFCMVFPGFSTVFPWFSQPFPAGLLHEVHRVQAERLRVALLREAPAELRQAAALLAGNMS